MIITKEKVNRKIIEYLKKFKISRKTDTKLLFIMGSGRSGTSILTNLLDHSFNTEVHGETSKQLMKDYMLLFKNVKKVRYNSKSKVVVAKPILNSFQINKILKEFKDVKIIWMIRNHKDVINSALNKFGPKVGYYLKEMVNYNIINKNNWVSKTIPNKYVNRIEKMNTSKFTDSDWMGLVWWSVNQIILETNLINNPRIKIIRYKDFILNPEKILTDIKNYIGENINTKCTRYIYNSSLYKGQSISLNKNVNELCQKTFAIINNAK